MEDKEEDEDVVEDLEEYDEVDELDDERDEDEEDAKNSIRFFLNFIKHENKNSDLNIFQLYYQVKNKPPGF